MKIKPPGYHGNDHRTMEKPFPREITQKIMHSEKPGSRAFADKKAKNSRIFFLGGREKEVIATLIEHVLTCG